MTDAQDVSPNAVRVEFGAYCHPFTNPIVSVEGGVMVEFRLALEVIRLRAEVDTLTRKLNALTMHMNQVHATLGGTDTVLTLEAAQHVVFERDEAVQELARLCQWREDDSDFDTWKTGCGHLWQFNTGGPKENGTKFCQYCGGALTAALTQEAP